MAVNLFNIAALNVRGGIGRNTDESVKKGPLNYVTKFYSSNLKAAILVTARFVFCQANLPRAMEAGKLAEKAAEYGLKGEVISDVNEALQFARKNAQPNDLIFVGGSTFVVAEIEDL